MPWHGGFYSVASSCSHYERRGEGEWRSTASAVDGIYFLITSQKILPGLHLLNWTSRFSNAKGNEEMT